MHGFLTVQGLASLTTPALLKGQGHIYIYIHTHIHEKYIFVYIFKNLYKSN